MVKVLRLGQMVQSMTVATYMAKSMEKADSHGLMAAPTLETSKIITYRVMEHTIGLTEECLLVYGSTIRWRETELSPGQMVENMR